MKGRPPGVPQGINSAPQHVSVQAVPKAEVENTITRIRPKLLRAEADLTEAALAVEGVRNVICASSAQLKRIPLIGSPIDRDAIAGDEELERLNNVADRIHALIERVKEVDKA